MISKVYASVGSLAILSAGFGANAQQTVATAPPSDAAEVTVIAHVQPLAPSVVKLDTLQPTSEVQADFLRNNIVPLASVDDIIKFQPSVWSQNPNGPGIGKAESISLRGFQDSSGQFNMTFDGIPFGDATDLHHTTSSIFIAHDLGAAEVDRGPGTASTIGKATFGGTIGFRSKAPDSEGGVELYGTYGSFETKAFGIELDTGQLENSKGFIDLQNERTHGYLTGSSESRTNFAAKYVIEVNPKTQLTLVASYNKEFQYTTQGATLAEYAQFGDNYGLCYNPALQCYYGYQPSNYYSSFNYVNLKTEVGPVRIQNTAYEVYFEHDYAESKDASDNNPADNGVTQYNPTTLKKIATYASDIPGKRADAQWTAFGDIIRFAVDTPFGELRTGFWFDQQDDDRYSYNTDITTGLPNIGKKGTAYSYSYKDVGWTYQPYIELEWRPIENLSVVPGFKYTSYTRFLDAQINKSTGVPVNETQTYSASQPSVAANYRIMPTWSVYAQAARGFQAPPINVFQVNLISPLKPETTWNYQLGSTFKGKNWSLSGDVYYIDFSNYLSQQTIAGSTNTTFVNGGGAIYEGAEFEGQYAVTRGLSLYGNYTYNSAKYKGTRIWLEEVPEWTASAGILYDAHRGPYASLIGKLIGPHFGDDGGGTGDAPATRVGVTGTADFAAGWHFNPDYPLLKHATVSLKISNIFDARDVSDFAGYQAATNTTTFWRLAGRSVFLNLDGKF